MKLEQYLRNDFNKYIRPLFIKASCEVCESTEQLELHHSIQFSELLKETLKELKLDRKDTKDYTKSELESIRNFMIAKQLKIEYKTLCKKCHGKETVLKSNETISQGLLKSKIYAYDISNLFFYELTNIKKAFDMLLKQYKDDKISTDYLIDEIMQIANLHPEHPETVRKGIDMNKLAEAMQEKSKKGYDFYECEQPKRRTNN